MLMVGRHPACKKTDRRVLVICLEWGADLHMIQLMPLHPKTSSSLASFKSRLVLPFWYRLTRVVPDKLLAAENRDKGDNLWLNAHVVCSTDSYLCLLCLLCKISSCRPWCSGSTLGRRLSLLRGGGGDGHGPGWLCRHGPGLSCGCNTRSHKCVKTPKRSE